MEKLIELLNEYEGYKEDEFESWKLDENGYLTEGGDYFRIGTEMKVVSKAFGFIKWLVDNDKIDLGKLIMIKDEEQKAIVDIDNSRENTLLMLLAISDTPIDDLISYLK